MFVCRADRAVGLCASVLRSARRIVPPAGCRFLPADCTLPSAVVILSNTCRLGAGRNHLLLHRMAGSAVQPPRFRSGSAGFLASAAGPVRHFVERLLSHQRSLRMAQASAYHVRIARRRHPVPHRLGRLLRSDFFAPFFCIFGRRPVAAAWCILSSLFVQPANDASLHLKYSLCGAALFGRPAFPYRDKLHTPADTSPEHNKKRGRRCRSRFLFGWKILMKRRMFNCFMYTGYLWIITKQSMNCYKIMKFRKKFLSVAERLLFPGTQLTEKPLKGSGTLLRQDAAHHSRTVWIILHKKVAHTAHRAHGAIPRAVIHPANAGI